MLTRTIWDKLHVCCFNKKKKLYHNWHNLVVLICSLCVPSRPQATTWSCSISTRVYQQPYSWHHSGYLSIDNKPLGSVQNDRIGGWGESGSAGKCCCCLQVNHMSRARASLGVNDTIRPSPCYCDGLGKPFHLEEISFPLQESLRLRRQWAVELWVSSLWIN